MGILLITGSIAYIDESRTNVQGKDRTFAELECLDTARPLNETFYGDIKAAYDCLEYMSGLAGTALNGTSVPLEGGSWGYTRREPVGVCVGIGAWNYPLQSAVWKSAPALAAGNSIILKPAPETPLTALEIAKLYIEAGVPSGCVNVLLGERRGRATTSNASRYWESILHRQR